MKALVLTYDNYKIFADHMINSYQKFWPDNPFIFVIPYQDIEVKKYYEAKYKNKVDMVYTPSDIAGTINTLLNGFSNEEWVYWCMDDRYLIEINLEEMKKTYEWVCKLNNPEIAAVKCTSHLMGQSPENISYFRNIIRNDFHQVFYQRKNYAMIWIHQFLRCKVLKDIFIHIPNNLQMAKHMDFIVNELAIPSEYRLYSNKKSLMVLGESTSLGRITKNCYESLLQNGYDIPNNFRIIDEYIISGDKKSIAEKIYFYSKRILRHILQNIGFKEYFKKRDIRHNRIKKE